MKSWNRKGSQSAQRRMAELRDAKCQHLKRDLIAKWELKTGERFTIFKIGLNYGCGTEAVIDRLRSWSPEDHVIPTVPTPSPAPFDHWSI